MTHLFYQNFLFVTNFFHKKIVLLSLKKNSSQNLAYLNLFFINYFFQSSTLVNLTFFLRSVVTDRLTNQPTNLPTNTSRLLELLRAAKKTSCLPASLAEVGVSRSLENQSPSKTYMAGLPLRLPPVDSILNQSSFPCVIKSPRMNRKVKRS